MEKKISATIEAAVLDETEEALNEFVRTALLVGISRGQMALMLQTKANNLVPPIIVDATTAQTVQ